MNQVRTTITLPDETHRYLMALSFQNKKTLGELVDLMVKNRNILTDKDQTERKIDDFRALCRKLAKKGKKIDPVGALREERDRRVSALGGV